MADESAMTPHFTHEHIGGIAFIESSATASGDPLKGFGQIRLFP